MGHTPSAALRVSIRPFSGTDARPSTQTGQVLHGAPGEAVRERITRAAVDCRLRLFWTKNGG